jgi:hypothetical protein
VTLVIIGDKIVDILHLSSDQRRLKINYSYNRNYDLASSKDSSSRQFPFLPSSSLCQFYRCNAHVCQLMALGINAGRPHTGTGRCCSQFIYSMNKIDFWPFPLAHRSGLLMLAMFFSTPCQKIPAVVSILAFRTLL